MLSCRFSGDLYGFPLALDSVRFRLTEELNPPLEGRAHLWAYSQANWNRNSLDARTMSSNSLLSASEQQRFRSRTPPCIIAADLMSANAFHSMTSEAHPIYPK